VTLDVLTTSVADRKPHDPHHLYMVKVKDKLDANIFKAKANTKARSVIFETKANANASK